MTEQKSKAFESAGCVAKGYVVLETKEVADHGIMLVKRLHAPIPEKPYVTWAYEIGNMHGNRYWGHYDMALESASKDFAKR